VGRLVRWKGGGGGWVALRVWLCVCVQRATELSNHANSSDITMSQSIYKTNEEFVTAQRQGVAGWGVCGWCWGGGSVWKETGEIRTAAC
jgi:dienelactone hydrolase